MKKHIQEKYKTGKQNNVFSYGKWFQSSQKPLTRIQRIKKIQQYFNQY